MRLTKETEDITGNGRSCRPTNEYEEEFGEQYG